MARTGADLLSQQLAAAIEEWQRGDADALEVAAIAGLLSRIDPDLAAQVSPASLELSSPTVEEVARGASERILDIDEGDEPLESWDALSALDEACAAAAWLAMPEAAAPAVDDVLGSLHAFPEAWVVHGPAATALLASQPPVATDPARRLWAAVEASVWTEAPAEPEELPIALRERLGFSVVVQLRPFVERQQRMAAAHGVPEPPPWTSLARDVEWELALTLADDGAPILLLVGSPGAFQRDGHAVVPVETSDGWVCSAVAGQWTVTIGGRSVQFEVAE